MPQAISLKGYDYQNGKFVQRKIHVILNDSDILPGFSQPITQNAFSVMQSSYLAELKQAYDAATPDAQKVILKKTIAVTFGKQAIELILAQEGCEGIRFSFAQSFEEDKHETLVAQGVAIDPNDKTKVVPLMQPALDPVGKEIQETSSPLYFEVVPPNTYGDYLANQDNNQVLFMF